MSLILTTVQKAPVALRALDAKGNPASFDGPATFETTDPTIVSLGNVTPTSCDLVAGAVGTAQIRATVDADLGAGVRPLVGILDIEVLAAEAVTLELVPGPPTGQ